MQCLRTSPHLLELDDPRRLRHAVEEEVADLRDQLVRTGKRGDYAEMPVRKPKQNMARHATTLWATGDTSIRVQKSVLT